MSKTHEIKITAVMLDAIERGDKRFEIRKNDRYFQTGDTLVLREYDVSKDMPGGFPSPPWPAGSRPDGFTGRQIEVLVTFMLHGPEWGLEAGHCVMSIYYPAEAGTPL